MPGSLNSVVAQNLVPNPGFEQKTACPSAMSGINLVEDWFSPTNTTPDYFNSCSILPTVTGVPANSSGYQFAKDGEAYCGIIAHTQSTPFFAEYLTAKLTDTLIKGLSYSVSFNVSLAELNNYRLVAISKLGAHLSVQPPTTTTTNLAVPYSIIHRAGSFLSDTSSWMLISGVYEAKGGERYITIGCFDEESIVDTQQVTKNGVADACYYYVDVVSVSVACDTVSNSRIVNVCDEPSLNYVLNTNHPYYMQNGTWNTGDNGTSLIISETGTYWYRSTYGCYSIIDTFQVVGYTDSINTKYDTVACSSEFDGLLLSASPGAKSYLWSNGSVDQAISVQKTGIYWCKVLKDCTLFFEEYNVREEPRIENVDLGPDLKICKNESDGILLGNDNSSSVKEYKWSTGNTECCIFVSKAGTYIRTISTNCAQSTDTIIVTVQNNCNSCLYFPDAFTPNKDGLNDIFKPILVCTVDNFVMRIYNRWGQVVFTSYDVKNGWNGLHGASLADISTYYYLAEYSAADIGERIYLKEQVMLIR